MNAKAKFASLRRMCSSQIEVTHVERIMRAWDCTSGSKSVEERIEILVAELDENCRARLAESASNMLSTMDIGLGMSTGGPTSELSGEGFVPREFFEAIAKIGGKR